VIALPFRSRASFVRVPTAKSVRQFGLRRINLTPNTKGAIHPSNRMAHKKKNIGFATMAGTRSRIRAITPSRVSLRITSPAMKHASAASQLNPTAVNPMALMFIPRPVLSQPVVLPDSEHYLEYLIAIQKGCQIS
jgi:hypothetical protein